MDGEWLDSDGYPTEAALARIRNAKHPTEALDAIVTAWNDHYGSVGQPRYHEWRVVGIEKPRARYLRLATGGWSGNEDVIDEAKKNFFACMQWRLSARGGVHIYEHWQEPKV